MMRSFFLLLVFAVLRAASVVTDLRETDQSGRVPQAAGAGRPVGEALTKLYDFDGSLIGKGGWGATFRATQKSDGMPMVVKQQSCADSESEIVWGVRSIKQGFGDHDNLCLVRDAFDGAEKSFFGARAKAAVSCPVRLVDWFLDTDYHSSWFSSAERTCYSHVIMRVVEKGTTQDYSRIGFDVSDPGVLKNAELFELVSKKIPLVNVKKENLSVAGPCAADIQCAFARIAKQTLCGISALQKIHSEEAPAQRITIVHQDIKPENILLGKFGERASPGAPRQEDLSAKIIDLGFAQASGATAQIIGGCKAHLAPETILGLSSRGWNKKYFKAAGDTFAVGLTLLRLINLQNPVYNGERLYGSSSFRSKCLEGNRFTTDFQKDMDNDVLGLSSNGIDPGRQQ